MYLNSIKPGFGSNPSRRRLGRGIGSGLGKTAGRGHKGQKSRAGGFHKTGFEGGQMPLQRRLPKRGFVSLKSNQSFKIRLSTINELAEDNISLATLKERGIVSRQIKHVKVYLSGNIERKVTLSGISVTSGVKAAIESVGGSVE